jgi:hypothetical protein
LLRAGVAPRHVRRYLRELADHYDDALRAELAAHADVGQARRAAWTRLGSEDNLARSMLDRPELRSTAARFPRLVFGVAPALGWVGAPPAFAAVLSLLPEALRRAVPIAEAANVVYVVLVLYTRLLPVVLGAVLLRAAANRRLQAIWPIAGAAVVDVLAGTLSVYILPGELGITSSLLPWLAPLSSAFGPKDSMALATGLVRGAALLALGLGAQQLLQRWRPDELTPAR